MYTNADTQNVYVSVSVIIKPLKNFLIPKEKKNEFCKWPRESASGEKNEF